MRLSNYAPTYLLVYLPMWLFIYVDICLFGYFGNVFQAEHPRFVGQLAFGLNGYTVAPPVFAVEGILYGPHAGKLRRERGAYLLAGPWGLGSRGRGGYWGGRGLGTCSATGWA